MLDPGRVIQRTGGGHLLAARVVALGSAGFWALPFFGLIDLAVPVAQTPGFYVSYLLETGWGVLYTFLVATPFLTMAVRPLMTMPIIQVALVAACLAVTAVAAGSWLQLAPAALLLLSCYALARLARHRVGSPAVRLPRVDPVVAAVAVVLLLPALPFAADMVDGYREGRPPLDDDTWGIDHWPTQAALALAVAAVALTVAVGVRAHRSGSMVSAGSVAVAAAWFGFWSHTYPGHAGSAGEVGGIVLMVWACIFLGVVGWRLAVRRAAREVAAGGAVAIDVGRHGRSG